MYFNYLLDQFRQATGRTIDMNSREFTNDFAYWLKDMQNRGKIYIKFLESIGLKVNSYNVAEIGKGKSDSIVKDLETTIITPYPEGIDRDGFNYSRLINAKFKIYNGIPTLLTYDMQGNQILDTLAPSMFNTFMTQNPYTLKQIAYWDELHNNGEKNIILGVFGNIHDKNKNNKIKELKELKEKLYAPYQEDYTIENDTYNYVIASDRKVKKKYKTR